MNILILGSGGREHAIAAALSRSPRCAQLYAAPGNAGTQDIATNLRVDYTDLPALKECILEHSIDMIIIGPEQPLVAGLVDKIAADADLAELLIVGPNAEAAQLEGSKHFAKEFMKKYHIPTAGYKTFSDDQLEQAKAYIDTLEGTIVLKADGLAAGKGVLLLDDKAEAKEEIESLLGGKFGSASRTVVIEDFLDGIEFSVFVATDGHNYRVLPVAKDYKRIGVGDTGLNTGGMGSVSPVPFVDSTLMNKVIDRIVEPTIHGLREEHIQYSGFIFLGLIRVNGEPMVIEYNCRLGDPETQSVLSRLKTDMVDLCEAIATGKIDQIRIEEASQYAVTVMVVSGGYPEAYEKGKSIELPSDSTAIYYHSGTTISANNDVASSGGRVIAATAMHDSLEEAIACAQEAAAKVRFEGAYFRQDIGRDLLEKK